MITFRELIFAAIKFHEFHEFHENYLKTVIVQQVQLGIA